MLHGCFPVNTVKFLRTNFFTEHLWVTASNIIDDQHLKVIVKHTFNEATTTDATFYTVRQ